MTQNESGYRNLMAEIEGILEKIERNEIGVDDLPAAIQHAAELLHDCKEKLFKTEQEIEKMLKDEV